MTLTHGEWLDRDGDLTTGHLDVDLPIFPERLPLGQVDEVRPGGLTATRSSRASPRMASGTSGSRVSPARSAPHERHRRGRALRTCAYSAGSPAATTA